MIARDLSLAPGVTPNRGVAALFASMLLTLPLVAVQGPAHMTPMDAINFMVIAGYWSVILARRDAVTFPLLVPFWLIMLGSLISLLAAVNRVRPLLTLTQDVYLFLWFITLVHLLSRSCRIGNVAATWAWIACGVALLTTVDHYTGALGGRLAGTARATGTFANPNMFGNYLLTSFFVTWSAAAGGKRYLYFALAPLTLGILETSSNGALLGLLGGFAAFFVASPKLWKPQQLGALCVVAAIGIAVLGIGRQDLIDAAHDMLSSKRGEIGGAALKGAEERIPLWIASAQVFAETPIGVGPNNFDDAIGPVLGDYHGAHSEYVGMLIERGPLGFVGWCAILGSIVIALSRMRRLAAAGFRPLGIEPLYGALGALGLQAFVIELFHFRHFWLLLALIFGVIAQAQRASRAAPASASRSSAPAAVLEAA
jgi:hypothetical protein